MKKSFGHLPSGAEVFLYTISCGGITATVSDLGATLVDVYVPDADGNMADVALGYDDPAGYLNGTCFLGAVVGRSANRIKGSEFTIGGRTYAMTPNENGNNLHSGPDFYHTRVWEVVEESDTAVKFHLSSPDGDQGFPGNASIDVTYQLDAAGGLHIVYDAVCDKDTIFNLTNHSYFNLAGHDHTGAAMDQLLMLPARVFSVADDESVPTGEMRSVEGTPMDFRTPKAIGADIDADYIRHIHLIHNILFYWNFRVNILTTCEGVIENICKHSYYKPVTCHITGSSSDEILDKRHNAATDYHHHEYTGRRCRSSPA